MTITREVEGKTIEFKLTAAERMYTYNEVAEDILESEIISYICDVLCDEERTGAERAYLEAALHDDTIIDRIKEAYWKAESDKVSKNDQIKKAVWKLFESPITSKTNSDTAK